jgi:hypothetical protein
MWMSLMTSGVKILLRPRTVFEVGAVSSATQITSFLSAGSSES